MDISVYLSVFEPIQNSGSTALSLQVFTKENHRAFIKGGEGERMGKRKLRLGKRWERIKAREGGNGKSADRTEHDEGEKMYRKREGSRNYRAVEMQWRKGLEEGQQKINISHER